MTIFFLLALEVLFVSSTIILLWRMKARFGLALLYVFVGSTQYLQAVLAAVFFIRIGEHSFSPGSAVLFSSSLFAILLVYVKEGVPQARTLIYGIVLSNVALTVLSSITELQINLLRGAVDVGAIPARLFVLDVRLFVVGTVTVALDAFLLVISYEFLLFKVRGLGLFGRILVSLLGVLFFDSVVFTTGSFFDSPGYSSILVSQLASKTVSGVIFSIVLWVYLGVVDRKEAASLEDRSGEFRDVFSIITYQEKFDRLNAARARAEAGRELAAAGTRALLDEAERARAALLSILEDEQRAEAALRESEERLRMIIQNEPACVKLVAADGRLLEMNAAGLAMLGADSIDQVRGQPLLNLIVEEHRAAFARLHAAVMGGESGTLQFEVAGLKGVRRWLETHAVPLRNAKGRVTTLLGLTRDITERRQGEAAIQLGSERLRTLSRRLLEIQETERRQIARELHDEIGQALTATKINLQSLQRYPDPATIAARLSESVGIVERALGQVRSISLELRPPLLDDLGLAAALRWLTGQNARRAGLRVDFRSAAVDARFDATVETACFRVAQEALNNIVRHAGARNATMELRVHEEILHLRVSDDGSGFEVPSARRRAAQGASLGLLGMEERATLAGGGIEWRSTPGEGAEVHAWFPLPRPAGTSDEGTATA